MKVWVIMKPTNEAWVNVIYRNIYSIYTYIYVCVYLLLETTVLSVLQQIDHIIVSHTLTIL